MIYVDINAPAFNTDQEFWNTWAEAKADLKRRYPNAYQVLQNDHLMILHDYVAATIIIIRGNREE